MDALMVLIGAIAALLGGIAGAVIAERYAERRLRIQWRREDRLKSLEPIRSYLDELTKLVSSSDFAAAWESTAHKESKERREIAERLIELQKTYGASELGVSDPALSELLQKLRFDPEDIFIEFTQLPPDFGETYKGHIRAAYKRLEELGSEV